MTSTSAEQMTGGTGLGSGRRTPSDLRVKTVSGSRTAWNNIATGLIYFTLLLAFLPLAFLLYYVVVNGLPVMLAHFPDFFTKDVSTVNIDLTPEQAEALGVDTKGGMWPAIVGTLVITLTASLIAIPMGLLAAIYLNEYGKEGPVSLFLRFLSDVMSGVPSIVMGLFIAAVFTTSKFLIDPQGFGLAGLGGSLALACLMLPIVIRSAETILKLVPDDLRQASYALGCSKSRTVMTVVLPAALPGLTSGSLLAVARAAGETAPLLFTIGAATTVNLSPIGSNTALSMQIYGNAKQPFEIAVQRAWGAALTLILLVLMLSVVARLIAARFTVR